jgi:DUF2934 family protein
MEPTVIDKARTRTGHVPISEQQETCSIPNTQSNQSMSPCDEPDILTAKRAYELYSERGNRHGFAFDEWLDAERELPGQALRSEKAAS